MKLNKYILLDELTKKLSKFKINNLNEDIPLDELKERVSKLNICDLNKDAINKLCGEKWKSECYDIKHKYEMFAVLDKLRYLKESKNVLSQPYIIIDQEKDYFIKEELISNMCHFKLTYQKDRKKGSNIKFMVFYIINFKKFNEESLTIYEISEIIYNEFMKLSEVAKKSVLEISRVNIEKQSSELINNEYLNTPDIIRTYIEIEDKPVKRMLIKENSDEILHKYIKLAEKSSINSFINIYDEEDYNKINEFRI